MAMSDAQSVVPRMRPVELPLHPTCRDGHVIFVLLKERRSPAANTDTSRKHQQYHLALQARDCGHRDGGRR